MSKLFELGQMLATPLALDTLDQKQVSPIDLLQRHAAGDWGDICEADKELNNESIASGDRLLSSYKLDDATIIWVITEAKDDSGRRECTTLLLDHEY